MEMIMKNWGGYDSYLIELYDTLDESRKIETDPYKQLALDEQKKVVVIISRKYKDYLMGIGSDHGARFLRTLEEEANNLNLKIKGNTQEYMMPAFNAASKTLQKMKNEFVGFRLRP